MLLKCGENIYVSYEHENYEEGFLILAYLARGETSAMDEVICSTAFWKGHPGTTGFTLINLHPEVSIKMNCT